MQGKHRNRCTQPWLNHNVSNTINVRPDEWEDITEYIYANRKYFCGISLIPQSGDKDYQQAPMVTVFTSREIVREYGEAAIWCSGLIQLAIQNYEGNLWVACDAIISGTSKDKKQQEFINRCIKFADKYFDGNTKRLAYCLKDVYNWKIYCATLSS